MAYIVDDYILHQIELEKVKNGIVKKVLNTLDDADKAIKKELARTKGVYTKKRYTEISSYIKKQTESLKEKVEEDIDVSGLVEYELEEQQKILKKYTGDMFVSFKFPSAQQVVSSALFQPLTENTTFQSYLESISGQLYSTWDSAVRTGYLTGMTSNQISRQVLGTVAKGSNVADAGTIGTLRKSLALNTRTALQSFANEARTAVYERNDDMFSGYQFVATLDQRSCLVCGSLDGEIRKSLKEFPHIPIHYNCRCLIIPIIKGYEDLLYDGVRESENGEVSGKLTYSDWLERQPEEIQKNILGRSRYNLYRSGEKISNFVDDGRILTLAELKAS